MKLRFFSYYRCVLFFIFYNYLIINKLKINEFKRLQMDIFNFILLLLKYWSGSQLMNLL